MGSRQFVKNDSDLVGLLKEQTVRIIQRNYAPEGGIATNNAMGALKTQADELYAGLQTISGEMDVLRVGLAGARDASSANAVDIERLRSDLELTASGIIATYEYAQNLSAETTEFQKNVSGMIRLGFITYPGTSGTVFGIAV